MTAPKTRSEQQGSEGGDHEANAIRPPAISLPKGGGAIRGIGEKFAANPVTGTGSMTIPIATSPGRSGFGPQIGITYDSGAGNGPVGLGWNFSLPAITRKTDKGLPRYDDANDSDVFILSGAEDLVPVLRKSASGKLEIHDDPRPIGSETYRVRRYRPRIEGLFARLERWTNVTDARDDFWRSISKDNITTWYGRTTESRIADPADPTRIFTWLICQSHDDKGNVLLYEYKSEDSAGVNLAQAHERNRTPQSRSAQRYLKRIRYGNRSPYLPELKADTPWPEPPGASEPDGSKNWFFEVVFDYDDGHYHELPPDSQGRVVANASSDPPPTAWPVRNDPFSGYRGGFELRTYRLCRRVLMFHHIPDVTDPSGSIIEGYDGLVRSTDFTYSHKKNPTDARNPVFSFVISVSQSGYKRQPAGGYLKKSLPPVEFTYSEATIQKEIREVDPVSLENLPSGLDGSAYQWVDLDGEGLSGILTEQANGLFYKRNLSPINNVRDNGSSHVEARFAPVELIATKPSSGLAAGHAQFMDLAGDGQTDLVTFRGPTPGFYERTPDAGSWESFTPFASLPVLDWDDPNLKFVDLTGDGHADLLITDDDVFRWHPSLAEEGFGSQETTRQSRDEETGPRLVFADGTQSIYFADMSGDGLTDLVRINNGQVCYWPNLGYGRFGAKVTMDNSPWFDFPDQFDQKRIRLADVDGSGLTDILYLHGDGVRIYFNQSGNSWSQPPTVPAFPRIDNLASVQALDLLGNGTACLVWSSLLPCDAGRQMRYIDLMGGQKPHLLIKTVNNLGAETVVSYAPSTKFYLQDRLEGKPWITKLPFPVHVVEGVETLDRISRNRFVTRSAYHHGYFDGVEREFRGFGMVEQWDTEEFATLSASDALPDAVNIDAASHVPPVYTKTWFHTGAYLEGGKITRQFEREYYREGDDSGSLSGLTDQQLQAMLLPDTVPLADHTAEEEREACRALKGSIIRVETYAQDGTDASDRPYSVSESNHTVAMLQPRGQNSHAVFFAHPREAVDFHYERKLFDVGGKMLTDPRVNHSLTLKVDGYGNVLRSAAVAYGRRHPDSGLTPADQTRQTRTHVTFTSNSFTNGVDQPDDYRTPVPCESRTYELLKATPVNPPDLPVPDVTNRFRFDKLNADLDSVSDGAHDLPYEDWDADEAALPTLRRRLIEHVRTLYRKDDLTGPLHGLLALGEVESLALPGESYKLAFTPALLAQIYSRQLGAAPPENLVPDPVALFRDEGRYVLSDDHKAAGLFPASDPAGHWWIPSGRVFFSPNATDPPATEADIARNRFHLPHRFRDPFGSDTLVAYDPHHLFAASTTDALGNQASAMHDYRVLQPRLVTDPNGNRSAVVTDALGMIAGTAIMGKITESQGDLLDASFIADLDELASLAHLADPLADPHGILHKATSRLVYDLFAYHRSKDSPQPQPVVVYALVRETHHFDPIPAGGLKFQHSFSYSDGFGREIQKKIQAEPGPVPKRDANGKIIVGANGQPELTPNDASPRRVGSGWTIFNNKGKPVRQFEPFFTDTHRFESDVRIGVSPVLFYDPAERVVATLHPNHTREKAVFDPWRQTTYDVNDTIQNADGSTDPKSDPDVKGYFSRLPDSDYLPTWLDQRITLAADDPERIAAEKALVHRQTPATAHFDTLGRPFLTLADNGPDPAQPGQHLLFATRVELDIEGNQRAVVDAQGRIVMRYDYDLFGTQLHSASMEAGQRWVLNDATGKPIRAWNSRGHTVRTEYDPLRRPLRSFVTGADPAHPNQELLTGRLVYGEQHPESRQRNLRGQLHLTLDQAGVVTNEGHDFKGNPLRASRRIAREYKQALNWSAVDAVLPANATGPFDPTVLETALAPQLEADTHTSSTSYDALNRPTSITTPDNSVIRHSFNEANLLEGIEASLRGAVTPTVFVANINYDAKGQRERIEYGNGASTTYTHDPETFRLTRLRTTRPSGLNGMAGQLFNDSAILQDLSYTYDPAGNITRIADASLRTLFHSNQQIEPVSTYTYDALYRLLEATGREHIGQSTLDTSVRENDRDYPFAGFSAHPNDAQAVRNYREEYAYDEVGNFKTFKHHAANGTWMREYFYGQDSLIEGPAQHSNRLSRTTVSGLTELYTHDAHGNMTSMPHLSVMEWDFKDQLHASQQQVVNSGSGERTYYVYDAAGQRARKVTERANGTRKQERSYLGGFEVYREFDGAGNAVTLERDTLHMLDDEQRIALVETKTVEAQSPISNPNPQIRYQLSNHLGSASLELDHDAALVSYEEYHPYGTSSYQAGRSVAEVSLKRYRYTGMERDEETGLNYHRARYYAPWLGRWLCTDPWIFNLPQFNPYAYSALNPIRFVDLTGHGPKSPKTPQTPAPASTAVTATQAQLMADVDEYVTMMKKYPTESAIQARVSQLYGQAQARWIQALETMQGMDGANINLLRDQDKASKLFDRWRTLSASGNQLHTRVQNSGLPTGTDVGFRQTPERDVLRAKLIAAGAAPPPPPPPPPPALPPPPGPPPPGGGPNEGSGGSRFTSGGSRGPSAYVGPAFNVVAGVLQIYNGVEYTDTECKIVGVGGGGLMVAGGLAEGIGIFSNSSTLVSVGSKVSFAGRVVTAPLIAYQAYGDITSGDPVRELTGTLDAIGIVSLPAAGLSLYQKAFVQPAAERFYETASRNLTQLTGMPVW